MSKLDDEIAELKRKIPDITPHNIQHLRQLRAKEPKLTAGKRLLRLEKRMLELETEVERLRKLINHIMPDKSDDV